MFYVFGFGKGVDGVKGILVWYFFFIFLGGDEFFLFYFFKKNWGFLSYLFVIFFFLLEKGIFWKFFLDFVLELCYGFFFFWIFFLLVDI